MKARQKFINALRDLSIRNFVATRDDACDFNSILSLW